MQPALDQFRINLKQVRQLVSLYKILKTQTMGLIDLSDILRAAFVFGLGALDFCVHELVRLGMLEIHDGKRSTTRGFLKFGVSIESARTAVANPADNRWLDGEIRARHGWQSFQQPESITKAIRLISDKAFWNSVASAMGEKDATELKLRLSLIVDRRNEIVHEADMDPTYLGARWPIDQKLVDDALDFIERFAESLFAAVS